MTPEARKTLLNLISEYGDSLTRIEGERELMKAIEARAAHPVIGLTVKAFRRLATAYHRDQVAPTREALEEQLDAFEAVRFEQTREHLEIES